MNIDQLKNKLTQNQYKAATSNSQNILVLAGAGTGKTSTIIGRVSYLAMHLGIPPEQILMLAFGKDAAKEMQERLESVDALKSVEVRTFHSLGLNIVSKVEKKMPKLTSLSEDQNLEKYIETICTSDSNKLYEYFTFYENDLSVSNSNITIWRSLRDDFFDHPIALITANILFMRGIDYISNCLYEKDIYLIKKYQPYEVAFYLPKYKCYLGIYDTAEQINIHNDFGTKYINLNSIFESLDVFEYSELFQYADKFNRLCSSHHWGKEKIFNINSKGRIKDLSKLLLDVFLFVKSNPDADFTRWQYKKKFLGLWAKEILHKYNEDLTYAQEIDYDRMIVKSTQYVAEKKFTHNWKCILVDEFQDISKSRFELLQELVKQETDIGLFCVGDDWQTIYQFAGSELKYIRNLDQYVQDLEIIPLDRTFRFHNALASISSKFVQKNPNQYKKSIKSLREYDGVCVSLLEYEIDLWYVLNLINKNLSQTKTCLILSRFNYQLPLPTKIDYLNSSFNNLEIKASTIHKSKGREADFVIILNVESGEMGLPSEKESEIELYASEENFPHAQERRVFYVALTRAREHVFIYYSKEKLSLFIEELLLEEKYVKPWNESEVSQLLTDRTGD
ncbi:UvrD-helicase domain-containing protein [Taylorella equigenitalis]|uniref:UvrD-helicase domain-containing protein n=1 Tax=Taylorella equigenitalis TaxID=29575 RepID=UPI00041B4917|nr:UvrD-helicase domain-containing protein [Taylorella equigenitalis]WDU48467.1 UvrD-helicase domain-containing protein [Taylorella equigenitalis]